MAAVLVASIRLHFADVLLNMGYRGPRELPCDASLLKGQEMGWFEHGSTIIVFAQSSQQAGHLVAYYAGLAGYLVFFSAFLLVAPLPAFSDRLQSVKA